MAYSIEYKLEEDLIQVKIEGKMRLPDLFDAALDIIRTARQGSCRNILTDLRQAELDVSKMEMYSLPVKIAESIYKLNSTPYHFRRAFVGTADQKVLKFYETVSLNNGHNVMLFDDVRSAKDWLLEKQDWSGQ